MDGTAWLDNPMIYSVPAPGAFALLGLASIVGARRRRD
jgi:MYXO-CTERM domain-containing protein